jgi:hypothetical protein
MPSFLQLTDAPAATQYLDSVFQNGRIPYNVETIIREQIRELYS